MHKDIQVLIKRLYHWSEADKEMKELARSHQTVRDALIEALNNKELTFQKRSIVRILGEVQEKKAETAIRKFCESATHEPSLKRAAALALANITGEDIKKYLSFEERYFKNVGSSGPNSRGFN